MDRNQTAPDVLIVGAGFAGLYMLHLLRERGFSARVFEKADDVGGTWYWNRYPGARCDVESVEYCYEFSDELIQDWNWTERYAAQPEILAYLNHVAERFELRPDITFRTEIVTANFDEDQHQWTLTTAMGESHSAQFCVFATGCLSVPLKPELPGMQDFSGNILYTGEWPHEQQDFTGKRVGVVGTGSSGIQAIPLIAEEAEQLTVFQRSPSYTVPAANRPLDPVMRDAIKADYTAFRNRSRDAGYIFGARLPANGGFAACLNSAEQQGFLEQFWNIGGLFFLRAFGDLQLDETANEIAQQFVLAKIREVVADPATAKLLSPHALIGCKRLCADTGYYQTFNRDNVSLVDINEDPLVSMDASGVNTQTRSYGLDTLVFATGFDAMTGALDRVDIRGRQNLALRDSWAEGAATFLGLQTSGFPNLFIVTGPGSPSVLSNMVQSIEQNVEWLVQLMSYMRTREHSTVEAQAQAQVSWMEHVAAMAELTLYPRCNSWYRGANMEGKPQVFTPLVGYMPYVERCEAVAAADYDGFSFG